MPEPVRHTVAGRTARVMIVDDDANTLDILDRWLRGAGYETVLAHSGERCLERLEEGPVDAIVLDVMMPEMDGLQVCARLRENPAWRTIPVLLVTARDDFETRSQGMRLGVSEYITKPVNRDELLTRLAAQVRTRELHRRLSETDASLGSKPGPRRG